LWWGPDLGLQVGDVVQAKDPTKAKCTVLAVKKGAKGEHDAILVVRSEEEIWQDGYWFRILRRAAK